VTVRNPNDTDRQALQRLSVEEIRQLIVSLETSAPEQRRELIALARELERRGTAAAERVWRTADGILRGVLEQGIGSQTTQAEDIGERTSAGEQPRSLVRGNPPDGHPRTAPLNPPSPTFSAGQTGIRQGPSVRREWSWKDIVALLLPPVLATSALLAILGEHWLILLLMWMLLVSTIDDAGTDYWFAIRTLRSPLRARIERRAREAEERAERSRLDTALQEQARERELERRAAAELASAEWWKEYRRYLQSDPWKRVSKSVLVRDKYICRECGGRATQVHHLRYTDAHRNRDFRRQPRKNLVALCARCHQAKHRRRFQ